MKKVAQLVSIPAPGAGHLTPQIEFVKRLLDRDDRFSITVILLGAPLGSDMAEFTKSLAASDTRIRFIHLPQDQVKLPPEEFPKSVEKSVTDLIDSCKPHVKDAIINHILSDSNSVPLAGLILDLFCTSMIDVGNELGVPSYMCLPVNAAMLGFMLNFLTRHDQVSAEAEFEEFEAESIIPCYANPVPRRVLPLFLFNKYGGCTTMMKHGRRFKETKGIIVNSYAELESHAVKSLLNIEHLPPIYTVGPLIDLKGQINWLVSDETQRDEIVKWLDHQPPSSVVFLCFGSMGSFGKEQVKEIAVGLEQSGQKFLWSLRKPPPKDKFAVPGEYTSDLQEILPNGFLERTKNIGKICGWAPQKEVLSHRSIGGFVSHCGWNSILESLWYGVPIVTWPLYAEQHMNAFEMVRDLGLAVELRLDYRKTSGDVVLADEIARAIRSVMDSDNKVRKKVREESEKSRFAVLKDDGSSFEAYGRFIENILRDIP